MRQHMHRLPQRHPSVLLVSVLGLARLMLCADWVVTLTLAAAAARCRSADPLACDALYSVSVDCIVVGCWLLWWCCQLRVGLAQDD